ncbi:DinG family ATP-dependent helicase YoaA [hydrothermal vent metagenome]|uniref:DNA 5'-3' helicase n=1 Tax=hydrothermal vent metagenome TaxID=652676 RepID=A0A3B0VDN8_9ZZZZ
MSVIDILGENGVFAEKLDGFKVREVQLQLADKIIATIEANGTLLAEAGTGTGKTFAYLVPAIIKNKKTIVSTGTKNLQEQLYYRDLPKVLEIMELQPKVRLLKGRANYLCHHRMYQALHSKIIHNPDLAVPLQLIEKWSHTTEVGDRAELEGVAENDLIWRHVTSTADNCLGNECPSSAQCLVNKARQKAMGADILVVNHHLLFADMALKQDGFGELLPEAEVIILDEAHQVPEIASRFFSQTLSSYQCQDLLNDVLKEAGEVTGAHAVITTQHQQVEQSLRDLYLQFADIKESDTMTQLLQRKSNKEHLQLLQQSIAELAESLKPIITQSKGLQSCFIRCEDLEAYLDELLGEMQPEFIYWYENRNKFFIFHKTPIDIADPLTKFRQENQAAWILTSATLAVNKSFAHFQSETGFFNSDTLLVDSPFDYANHAMIYVPKDVPDANDISFNQAICEHVLPLIAQTKGGVFFLFTSHKALRNAAQFFQEKLEKPLFVQGQGSRHQILADFTDAKNGVLLGAASFWEGVDVAGDSLSCVIIDKLPFAHPDNPVLQARINKIVENGGNSFFDYQLPKAIIALKQGAGRLIRSETDKGILVICDKRIMTKAYGQQFINSLPNMQKTSHKHKIFASFAKI